MSRLLFFLLLIAVLAVGTHLWLTMQAGPPDFSARERNRDEVRIVAATPPPVAARRAEQARRTAQSLAGAPCIEFSGISAADTPRARAAFEALQLGSRAQERPVEQVTRYWVFVPPARDRRAAEASMAQLRRLGVADISLRPDYSISLGVFSSEEAARRFLGSLEARGVTGAEYGAFARDVREVAMLIREPDTELVARLAVMQRDFPGSQLRAVSCPAP